MNTRGVLYSNDTRKDKMRTSTFESLAWLIGQPIRISGVTYHGGYEPDGEVKVIAEYPDTILVDFEFIVSRWGLQIPPRHLVQMIPKAALACGDVRISVIGGSPVTPDMVAPLKSIRWHREEDEVL